MSELDSAPVLVTGGGRGIGRAIIRNILSSGGCAVAVGRSHAKDTELYSDAEYSNWVETGRLRYMRGDLTSLEQTKRLLERLNDPKPRAFVHAAGSILQGGSIRTDLAQSVSLHAGAAIDIITTLCENSNPLRAVLVSSIATKRVTTGMLSYAASKTCLEEVVRYLAVQLGPTLQINAISPGLVRTSMSQDAFANEDEIASIIVKTPSGALTTAEDVASLVEFLISDNAKQICGQNIVIDGGNTLSW